jgi:phosphate transport system protein
MAQAAERATCVDPASAESLLRINWVSKNIERMGDHVTAIAEQVIYLVEGHLPDDDRPKGDITSTRAMEGSA